MYLIILHLHIISKIMLHYIFLMKNDFNNVEAIYFFLYFFVKRDLINTFLIKLN